MRIRKAIGIVFVALAATTLFAGTASADCRGKVHRRERAQQERIARGIHSGALTPREVARLEVRQARIHRHARRAAADGVLAPWECRRLRAELDRASQHIRHEMHDRQRRR